MIKAIILGKIVSLNNGVWSCNSEKVLEKMKNMEAEYQFIDRSYHPQPELQKMEWICEKMKGFILYVEEPPEIDPDAEY